MPTGSATAGSPSALTAKVMRMARMVWATRPSVRSVPTLEGEVGEDRGDDQRMLLLELAPDPQQRLPYGEALHGRHRVRITGHLVELRHEPLGVGRHRRRHVLPPGSRLGSVEHVQQRRHRGDDRRRLDLLHGVAGILERIRRFPNTLLHLVCGALAGRVDHEGDSDGSASLGPRSGAGTDHGSRRLGPASTSKAARRSATGPGGVPSGP
jgi:hypothetical protein